MSEATPNEDDARARPDGHWRERLIFPQLPQEVAGVPIRKFTLGSLAAVVLAGGLGVGMLHTKLFAVDRIDILGANAVDPTVLLARSGVEQGDFLINVDGDEVVAKLESDPWVASATVDRDWPHVVKIRIRERAPIAIAQTSNKKWAVVGEGGVVLEIGEMPKPGLPNVLDIEAPSQVGQRLDDKVSNLIAVAAMMPDSLRSRVVQMREQTDGIRLGLNSGTIVMLGNSDDIGAKLTSAAAVIAHGDPTQIALLDVTSPESPLATPVNRASGQVSTSTSTTNPTRSPNQTAGNKPSTSAPKVSTSTSASSRGSTSTSTP